MLRLTIKRRWYDMIARGEKAEEYREIKPYWRVRLYNAGLALPNGLPSGKEAEILLVNGYRKDARTLRCRVKMSIGPGRPEWGAVPGVNYYRLEILEIAAEPSSGASRQLPPVGEA